MLHACYAIHKFLRVFLCSFNKNNLVICCVWVLFLLYFNKNCFSSFAFKPVPLCNAAKLSLWIMLLYYLTIIVCSKVESLLLKITKTEKLKSKMHNNS